MCRLLAYRGEPTLLSHLVCAAHHSLVRQSQWARESTTRINGDGIGLGWYGEQTQPTLYREAWPAWSDAHLQALCRHVRSPLFFAHVRASTGASATRSNCHPFANGNWMFMHNGQVGGYTDIRSPLEAMIPDRLYASRLGSSDSEAIFLLALAHGLREDPVAAMVLTLRAILKLMSDAGVTEPLRFTALVTNGETLFGCRWASDSRPPSLYYRETRSSIVLASEALDQRKGSWHAAPNNCSFVAGPGRPITFTALHIFAEPDGSVVQPAARGLALRVAQHQFQHAQPSGAFSPAC